VGPARKEPREGFANDEAAPAVIPGLAIAGVAGMLLDEKELE
jgi:hypothetical protein